MKRFLPFILSAGLALAGCGNDSGQTSDQASGGGHGHGGGIVITHFTDKTELFVEFPPFVVGQESAFAAHFTHLSDYAPVAEGTVTVRLSGGGHPDETFSAGPSATAGIFGPVAVPEYAGRRALSFEVTTPQFTSVHHVGEVMVHADSAAAADAVPEEGGGNYVSFLKETQWKIDFQVEQAENRALHASVPATGVIRGTPGGEARIGALAAGRLIFPDTRMPDVGQNVEAGDLLGYIVPRASGDRDVSALRAELARAEANYELAVSERKRIEGLFDQGAIPRKRLEAARAEAKIAEADLEAARARLDALGGDIQGATGVAVRAPIDGTIADISAGTGQYVQPGDPLFHVVKTDRLRLKARVSERDSLSLGTPTGAWFTAEGLDDAVTITQETGELIAVGRATDAVTRTIPVIFEFENPGDALHVGMHVSARVRTGKTTRSVAVPRTAIVDEQGLDIVYVMAGGESFERRIVQTGIRDGDFVEITSGLEAGERIVTEGAYLVRLAAAGPAEAGHGHGH